MSTVDTPFQSELNIWYHTLNCGYRTRISGETDFPCITGERVGKGRSYVKLDGKLDFDTWCEGIRKGRCYVSDGRSHLMDFAVNGQGVGDKESEIRLSKAGMVHATLKVAGLLPEIPDNNAKQGWYWNLERARIGTSREVTVEIIQNGYPVAQKKIVADGKTQDITFDVEISRSSWVAARILGSSHTNPVFIIVGEKPIRAFRRSAEWCLKSVDVCWAEKSSLSRLPKWRMQNRHISTPAKPIAKFLPSVNGSKGLIPALALPSHTFLAGNILCWSVNFP